MNNKVLETNHDFKLRVGLSGFIFREYSTYYKSNELLTMYIV